MKNGRLAEAKDTLEAAKKADPTMEETVVLLNNIRDNFNPEPQKIKKGKKGKTKKIVKSKKNKKSTKAPASVKKSPPAKAAPASKSKAAPVNKEKP
jgi:hypothetical protein